MVNPYNRNKRLIYSLILCHMALSLSGLLVHTFKHPLSQSLFFWWASPTSLFSFLILPILFIRPATVAWGFLLNGFALVVGTIGMMYYFLQTMEPPLAFNWILTESTLPATVILWLKLPLASAILQRVRLFERSPQITKVAE